MRWGLVALMASGCGRLGFDAHQLPASDAPVAGDGAKDGAIDSAIDAPPDGPPPPLAFVQATPVAQSGGGPVTAVLPAPSTAGTLLVVAIATNNPTSLALPTGWVVAVQGYNAASCGATLAFYENNPGGIVDIPVTINAGVPLEAVVGEWSGVKLTGAVDTSGMSSSSTPVNAQSVQTTVSTIAAGDLAVAMFCEDVNNPTYTSGAGWTNIGNFINVSSSPSFSVDYQLAVPVGVVSEAVTSSVGGKFQAVIAAFAKQ